MRETCLKSIILILAADLTHSKENHAKKMFLRRPRQVMREGNHLLGFGNEISQCGDVADTGVPACGFLS